MLKNRSVMSLIFICLLISTGATAIIAQVLPDTGKASVVWQYFNAKQYEGDKRLYTDDDLYPPYAIKGQASDSMIAQYLRLLRNEIYARHGRIFNSTELQEFYITMPWYKKNKVVEVNSFEKQNVVIVQTEEGKYKKLSNTPGKQKSKSVGYVKKILIEAQWGDGQGQYGLDFGTDPGPTGPMDFTISPNGDIYVLDVAGKFLRVNKYDKFGNFIDDLYFYTRDEIQPEERYKNMPKKIVVDGNERVMLLFYDNKILAGLLRIYDWNGNKIDECEVPWEIYGGLESMFLDNSKVGFRVKNSKWYIDYSEKMESANIKSTKKEISLTIGKSPTGNTLGFINNDKEGNIYFDYSTQYDAIYVAKYTAQGELLDTVKIMDINNNDYLATPGLVKKIDDRGNIYCMVQYYKDHLLIIKWECQ